MIQKKSLKDAIQNSEIISVVGELFLNDMDFIKNLIDKSVYSYAGNLDDINMSCTVKITDATTGIPEGLTAQVGSYCVTFNFDTKAMRQLYLRKHTHEIYSRYKSAGSWGGWNKIIG